MLLLQKAFCFFSSQPAKSRGAPLDVREEKCMYA